MTTVTYPFDPTGSNPLNRIVNEQHVLTSLNDTKLYQTIIPSAAPFFTDNAVLSFRNPDQSIRVLVEGVDYYFTHLFISATKATAKPVAGSITFLDKDITGVLRLTYQTLGGVWTLDDNEIATILANMIKNPRTTAWEQITSLPFEFPVIDHEWNLADMVGASEIVEAIDGIRDAVLAGNAGGIANHVNDKNNPHEVSKAQVGLSDVQNYPVASETQAQGGTNNTSYMTPLRVAQAIAALGGGSIQGHLTDYQNPHQTNKAQVGLALVQNYPMATNSEAVAGAAADRYMSPAATKAVFDIVQAALTAHEQNMLNPHNVTKNQISLFNVDNYATATAQEAQDGNLNDRFMTPLRTKQAIAALASGELTAHTMDFDNPHNTTKAQVGLVNVENYGIATQVESEGGSVNNKYMTPLRVAQAITAQVGQSLLNHLNATNPHNVTAAQVGLGNVSNYTIASQAEAEAGTAADRYMTPARTAQAIAAQIGTIGAHITRTDNPHNVTAAQVNAYTKPEIDTALLGKLDTLATAANSSQLEGSSKAQVVAEAQTSTMTQVKAEYAQQTKIAATARNVALADEVWVRLGQLSLDEGAGVQHGTLQWIITGGGHSEYDADRQGSQLKSILLSAQLTRDFTGGGTGEMLHEVSARLLSEGTAVDASVFDISMVVDEALEQLIFYAKVPNGHNVITVTDLSPFEWSIVDPLEMGETMPVGATPVTTTGLATTADLQVVVDEVTDMIEALQAAIAGAYPPAP